MNVDQITAQLRKLDVPPHKLDCTKPGTVQWLLDNLRQRNVHRGEAYLACMEELLELAKQNNWIKKTKLQELIDHVDAVRANPPESAEPIKIQSGQDRLRAQITAGTLKVRPPVRDFGSMEKRIVEGGFKHGEMQVFSGTNTGRIRSDQPNRSNTPQSAAGRVSRPMLED